MAYGPSLWALLFPEDEFQLDPFDEDPERLRGGGGGPIPDFGPVRPGGPALPSQAIPAGSQMLMALSGGGRGTGWRDMGGKYSKFPGAAGGGMATHTGSRAGGYTPMSRGGFPSNTRRTMWTELLRYLSGKGGGLSEVSPPWSGHPSRLN